jgi:hypothetical protein
MMRVKEVFFVRQDRFSILPKDRPEVESETIIVSDLVIIAYDSQGLHMYYKNMEMYLKYRFQYTVEDIETDITIVDLGEI